MKIVIPPRRTVATSSPRRGRANYWRMGLTLLMGAALFLAGLLRVVDVRAGSPDLNALEATWSSFYQAADASNVLASDGVWDSVTETWSLDVPDYGEAISLVPDTQLAYSCSSSDGIGVNSNCTGITQADLTTNPSTIVLALDGVASQTIQVHWISVDVTLASVTPSVGTLLPAFSPSVRDYTLTTTASSMSFGITATPMTGPTFYCSVNGVTDGTCEGGASLNIGANVFIVHASSQFAPIVSGAPDETKRRTAQYTLTVTRNAVLAFDPNGGSCDATEQKSHEDNVPISFPSACVLSGNVFMGWNTLADGTGTTYAQGAMWDFLEDGGGTLFAQWAAVGNTTTDAALASLGVTLNRSNPELIMRTGTANPTFDSDVVEYDLSTTSATITLLPITRSASAIPMCTYGTDDPLLCNADGSNVTFPLSLGAQDITIGTTANDTTTQATYIIHVTRTNSTVLFDGGSVTRDGQVTSGTSCEASQTSANPALALTTNTCALTTGYNFRAWNTVADGSGVDFDDQAAYDFPYYGSRTLYAQWQLDSYTVSYDPGAGDAVTSNTFIYESDPMRLPPATYAGHYFAGWYDGATRVGGSGASYTPGADIQLTAQWEEILAPVVTTGAADTITDTSAVLHATVNPGWASTTVEFCYGTTSDLTGCTPATAAQSPVLAGGTAVPVTFDLTGLTPGTLYYFNAAALNSLDSGSGSILSFRTPDAPVATTDAADTITSTSATLNGTVNPGWAETAVTFCYGTASDLAGCTTATAAGSPLAVGGSDQSVTVGLSDLAPGTLYYFRVTGSNSVSTVSGTIESFQTPADPTPTTSAATDITGSSATLNGTVNPGWASTTVEFCYGTASDLTGCTTATAAESPLVAGGSGESVSFDLTGLASGTLYYFRASATNSIGTTDGSILSFTTLEVLAPAVTTEAVEAPTSSSAMLHGTVNPGWASTTVEFCYGTAADLTGCTPATAAESPLAAGGSAESVSVDLTGLTDNTTYYFRVSATNTVGTTDGSILSFTTPEIVAPVVTTGAADTITSSSATLNGTVNPGWASTTVEFCYGTASDLTGCTTATAAESPLAAGDSDESVATSLVELLPGTLYYFRVSATNTVGTTDGNILSFQTPDAPAVVTVDADTITSTSATLRGTVNAMWDTTAVSFCYGTDELLDGCTSSAATPASVSGSSTTNASKALTGLTPGTLYYFRVSGTNAVSTSDGDILSFRTPDAPTATTDDPDTITSTSVSLHGTVDPGWAVTTVTFCYGTSASLVGCTSIAADESPLADESGSVSVNRDVSGLTPGTLYYVRVRAANSVSTTNGEILSFRTPATPDAISMTATDITPTSAMLYGTVHPGWDETSVEFCYGTASDLDGCDTIAADEPTVAAENPTTSVFATLGELTEGTRYYYRVIATNTVGTDSGSILYFDTPSIVAPSATTVAASSVAATSATLNASINPGWDETSVEFCYGTAANLAGCETVPATESPIVAGGSSVPVTADLTELVQNTLYYFRVRAENSVDPTNGTILSFRTRTIVAPVAVTSAASVITPTTATLNGTVNPGWDETSVEFCYGTSPTLVACDPVVADESPVAAGGSAVSVSASLTELSADTTYYYRTMTENSVSTANGSILNFHTPAIVAPLVVTVAASVVLSETATLNGTVNPGWDETAVTFCYGTASNLAGCSTVTATESPVVAGGTVVNASADLTGLTADTTYYFRIIGENTVSSANGTILSFHTNAVVAPTVITSPATSITLSTATLNGTVNPGWAETDATFCYGTASDLAGCTTVTADESPVAAGGSAVPVSAGITGLAPDTTYYFQASGENATDAASGIVRSFHTQVIAAPVATSAAATSLTASTATLNGTVNPSWAETTVTFCYGTAADLAGCSPGAATPATVAPSGSVTSVSKALTGLSASTTYYFRTSATNSNSTALGSILSFTTTSGATPTPSTTPTPSASNTPKPSDTPTPSNSPSPVPSPSVTPTPVPSVSPSASPDGGWVLGNWDDISKVLGIALLVSGGVMLLFALRSLISAVANHRGRSRRTRADEEWSRYNV